MKRVYEKPAFIAEQYQVINSIAASVCKHSSTEPIALKKGELLCSGGDNGHFYGGSNGSKGNLVNAGIDSVTLFNDGEGTACTADWAGSGNNVYYDGKSFGTFQQAFCGDGAENSQHLPADPDRNIFFS